MQDLALAFTVPQRGPVLDRIIADRNYKISGFEQPISRLVGELAYPPAEIVEQHRTHGARCLERTDYRQVVLTDECLEYLGVRRFACEHSQKHYRVGRSVNEARRFFDRGSVG